MVFNGVLILVLGGLISMTLLLYIYHMHVHNPLPNSLTLIFE